MISRNVRLQIFSTKSVPFYSIFCIDRLEQVVKESLFQFHRAAGTSSG